MAKRLPHERPTQRGISPAVGIGVAVAVIIVIIVILVTTNILAPKASRRPGTQIERPEDEQKENRDPNFND